MTTILRTLGALAATALIPLGASAQTFSAEKPVSVVTPPNISTNQPVVAAVGSNVYVAWVESFEVSAGVFRGDIMFSRSVDNGETFSVPVNLTNSSGVNDVTPTIAAGGAQVHIFWTDNVATGDILHVRSINSGASFFAPAMLTTPDGKASRPGSALVDASGNVHFAFYDNRAPANTYAQVYYKCSTDGGANWTADVNLTQFDGVVDNESPRLTQGTDGRLYLLFRTSRAGIPQGGWPPFEQYMMRTTAAMASCSPPWLRPAQKVSVGLPEEFANTFGGYITAGAGGVLHAAYWSDKLGTNLTYRRGFPNGTGWEAPIDLSGHGANHLQWDGNAVDQLLYGLAEDAAGKVHAVFGQNTTPFEATQTGPLYYRCSNDGGATWIPRQLATGQIKTAMPRTAYSNNRFHVVWMDFRDNPSLAEIYYLNVTTGACTASAVSLSLSTGSLAFGGQSMGTTSPPQVVTVTNTSGTTLSVSAVTPSAQFEQTNNCSSVPSGGTCTINVAFKPTPAAGPVNTTVAVNGTVSIASNASGSPHTVNVSGTAEKSLVTHYYRSILRRAPDGGGKTYWSGEATRLAGLGANVNETWFAMAAYFYFGNEYKGFNRDNIGFVTDLYNTFFNRAPDAGGLNFWVNNNLNAGVPREVVLVSFMFSSSFKTFTENIFGNTAARAEVDMVMDFYRGLLARLPDTGGFNSWVQEFRTAQCQGSAAVTAKVEQISSAFANGSEYTNRARNNSQYVGDLYNAFMRRGGDAAGVLHWINQLNTSAMTRNQVRQTFINTAEFKARVNAVIAQGCLP
jgi:hypothetical protein